MHFDVNLIMNMILGLHSQIGRCRLCMLSRSEVQGCKPWSNVHLAPGEPLARIPPGLQQLKEGIGQPGGKQLHHDSQEMDAVKLGCFVAAGHRGFGLARALEDCYLPGKGRTQLGSSVSLHVSCVSHALTVCMSNAACKVLTSNSSYDHIWTDMIACSSMESIIKNALLQTA